LRHDHPDWFTPEQLQSLLVTSSNRIREPNLNVQELARIAGTSPGVLDRYYLSHLTGQRVSERLMAKAILEFGEPQAAEEYTWATSAGVIKHSVKRPA
jgi:hypothetical protein